VRYMEIRTVRRSTASADQARRHRRAVLKGSRGRRRDTGSDRHHHLRHPDLSPKPVARAGGARGGARWARGRRIRSGRRREGLSREGAPGGVRPRFAHNVNVTPCREAFGPRASGRRSTLRRAPERPRDAAARRSADPRLRERHRIPLECASLERADQATHSFEDHPFHDYFGSSRRSRSTPTTGSYPRRR